MRAIVEEGDGEVEEVTSISYSREAGLPALSSVKNLSVEVPSVLNVKVSPEVIGVPLNVTDEVATPVPESENEKVTVVVAP